MPYTVAIFDPRGVCHIDVSIALRLARAGQCRVVLAADTASVPPPFEQGYLLDRLAGCPDIRLTDPDRPEPVDVLLVTLPAARRLPSARLRAWVQLAGRVVGVSELDATDGARALVRQLVRSFPHNLRCRRGLCRFPLPGWHPFRLLGRWAYFPPGVHPIYWLTPGLLDVMFGPPPTEPRDIVLSFAGNRSPDAREAILRQVEDRLTKKHGCRIVDRPPPESTNGLIAVFVIYSIDDLSKSLPAADFVRLLDRSQFCLCPPGGSTWTHRLTEAVVRGAIPIAEAAECRALGLRHLAHAVVVSGGNWAAALDQAIALTDDRKAAIRANLAAVTAARFTPDAAARELAAFLLPKTR